MHGAAHFGASALIAGFAFSLSAFAVASPVSPPTVPSTRHDAKYCGEVFDDGAYDVSVYITQGRGVFTCKRARAVVHAGYSSQPRFSFRVKGWTHFDWSRPGHGFKWLQAWKRDDGRVVVGSYYHYVPD